jgi:hypothetical protein
MYAFLSMSSHFAGQSSLALDDLYFMRIILSTHVIPRFQPWNSSLITKHITCHKSKLYQHHTGNLYRFKQSIDKFS